MSWAEDQRLAWIGETVCVFGFINREHIQRKFGISTPQASYDLRRFMDLHPRALTYDKHAKRSVGVTAAYTGGATDHE